MASKQPARVRKITYNESTDPPADGAQAAEEEATGKQTVLQISLGEDEVLQIVLPKRWKRFKFMRRLASGNVWGAIEAIGLADEELAKIEEAEVDERQMQDAFEALGRALTGNAEGKSPDSTSAG